MAAAAAAQLLDELMGKSRNLGASDKRNETNWDDPQVCKYFLCGFCPHELFVNTRADLGNCNKQHDDALKQSYEADPKFGRVGYEDEFFRFLQGLVYDVDRRIKRGHQRLALNSMQGNTFAPHHVNKEEKVQVLSERINELVGQAEELGCEGKVEEAQGLMNLCEQLKDERNHLETQMNVSMPQLKEMEVCEVCGAFLIVGDAKQRAEEHLMGKQHMGYAKVRSTVEEFKDKKKNKELEREEQWRLEREEREKEREKEREERRKRREDREKEREKEREERRKKRSRSRHRSRSRDRKRSRDHDRHRRSRSRDKKRSRSRDRKKSTSRDRKRSRSRERKYSSGHDRKRSRSRDRKRSRSRDRKRSRSRDRRGSKSRERRHRSRSRDRKSRDKRSRSGSRHGEKKRSTSLERDRKSDSDGRGSRERSKDRHRSRDHDGERRRDRSRERGHDYWLKDGDEKRDRSKERNDSDDCNDDSDSHGGGEKDHHRDSKMEERSPEVKAHSEHGNIEGDLNHN
ncbi:luc7-like protein 3 [Lineus longissimus]|uniref:luc7-like protein 3 n=1 Tax=Lineus longissimus TaxID=88925 RepID=UPI002B4F5285